LLVTKQRHQTKDHSDASTASSDGKNSLLAKLIALERLLHEGNRLASGSWAWKQKRPSDESEGREGKQGCDYFFGALVTLNSDVALVFAAAAAALVWA
jgi:hypothetical protein